MKIKESKATVKAFLGCLCLTIPLRHYHNHVKF